VSLVDVLTKALAVLSEATPRVVYWATRTSQAFGGPTTYGALGVETFFVDKELARRKGTGRVFLSRSSEADKAEARQFT